LQFAPDEVARWCDWPVCHADLAARKAELIKNEDRLLENLTADSKWCDPLIAGYWIWAASCWIGAGLTRSNQTPHLADKGKGVHSGRPHLGHKGSGVHSKRPEIGNKGKGVHKSLWTASVDMGKSVQEPYNINIYTCFRELSERLRYVRIVCGDWSRVCGGNWQDSHWQNVGIFFDPPYGVQDRAEVYQVDSRTIAKDVQIWAIERGKRQSYKIVYAGYEGECDDLKTAGWTLKTWKTGGGYAGTAGKNKNTQGKENSKREQLWFSPFCIKDKQKLLWELL
jgi:DNA adenine methylase